LTCELLQIARRIIDVVSNFSRLGVRQDADGFLISQIDLQLNTWMNDLPAEVNLSSIDPMTIPHKLMLHMTYHWLLIILHRPFYRRRSSGDVDGSESHHIKVRCLGLVAGSLNY